MITGESVTSAGHQGEVWQFIFGGLSDYSRYPKANKVVWKG